MAKSKVPKVEDLNGYLFMAINGTDVNIVYHDDTDNGLAIGAALTSVLEEDEKLFNIIIAAMLSTLEAKEKYSSKTAKKPVKKPTKAVNKK
jgi:hypothetical protein